MYMYRLQQLLLVTIFQIPLLLSAQVKDIGLPLVQNFSKKIYNADTQNWEIIEGENGFIYAANNRGIMQFNGVEWNIYPVANNSIVRSLALGNNGEIYAGAYNEFGRLLELPNGEMVYESLLDKVPEDGREFDDVWKTFNTRFGIIFQSFEHLFIYHQDYIEILEPETRFGFSFYINNNFYIVDKGAGLKMLRNNKLVLISGDALFKENEIRFILPHKSAEFLVGTLSGGIYILKNGKVSPWETEANTHMLENKIFSAIKSGDTYAVGSIKNGLYFIDSEGSVMQHINRSKGLQNNTVLTIYQDRSNNLWLGLDNGIDYVKTSLPLSILNYNYGLEATYASAIFNNTIYVGTNQGLFAKPLSALSDIDNLDFTMVKDTEGQVWNLTIIGNELLCGHSTGAYIINGMQSKKIFDGMGVWNFVTPSTSNNIILSGTYDGIIKFSLKGSDEWAYAGKIKGIGISARDLTEDPNGNFWISHGYKGVYKLNFNNTFSKVTALKLYNHNDRLPKELPYFVHVVDGQLLFTTQNGIYQYNVLRDNFLRPELLNEFYRNLDLIYELYEDKTGNIWYFTEENIGFFKLLEDGNYVNVNTPFKPLQNSMMASFSNINIYDQENIFLGTQDGLVHYNPDITKDYMYKISTVIQEVRISDSNKDSLWFKKGSSQNAGSASSGKYQLPFKYNNLMFRYASNDMENTGTSVYRVRLQGFSDSWSLWSESHDKEYTKLREGKYRFEVQSKNIYGNVSDIEGFDFIIKPPFYRSAIAYSIYIFIFLMLIISVGVYFLKRIEKIKYTEKSKQEAHFNKKTKKLQQDNIYAEQELVRLRNEQLRITMKHKNKELANATYHILQKNKFLNNLKNELSTLSKSAKSEIVETQLYKISRKIDRDIHHEQNWKVFNKYFDDVHQEFISRLKEKHPELTPKDLRLCGYLRMNISTKEIAPLLNISIRGVEISRYRLRKKLNLDKDANLTEYLIEF